MEQTNKYKKTSIRFSRYGEPIEFAIDKVLAGPAIDYQDEKYNGLLDDLQANILKRHKMDHTRYYFLHFHAPDKFQPYLAGLANAITSARVQLNGKENHNFNVYLTYEGYQLLNLVEDAIPAESAFSEGMQERTLLTKDEGALDFETKPIHAIILLAYKKMPAIKEVKALENPGIINGFEVVYTQSGQINNPLGSEYQFSDGISNPRFFPGAFPSTKTAKHSISTSDLSPMNIVLRHDSAGDKPYSCGSYGVFAKFVINEKAISTVVAELQKKLKIAGTEKEDLAKAHILGRFMDGTPLSLSDEEAGFPTNHFNYRELINSREGEKKAKNDMDGSRCPFHTHIRKANPRQAGDENQRIVRRGLFYEEDGEKGLLFVSFQNSLEKQFETVLNNWMLSSFMQVDEDDGPPRLVKTQPDILFSKTGDVYTIPKVWDGDSRSGSVKVTIPDKMISFRGGIYFFAPSISFFKKLSVFKLIRPKVRVLPRSDFGFPFLPGTEIQILKNKEVKGKHKFLEGTVTSYKRKKD